MESNKYLGKMTIRQVAETDGRFGKEYNVYSVYSYDHAIIVKSLDRIGFNIDHLTKTRYIKHYNQALELLYKDNASLYKKVLVAYNAVKRFCQIVPHDGEFNMRLYPFLDSIGLQCYGDGGKVWVRMTYA